MALLEVSNLGIAFGGLQAVSQFDLTVETGHLYGLIGPNGAGKTTVFNMLTGVYRPTEGNIVLDGKDVTGKSPELICKAGIARTFQNIRLFDQMTVLDNVKAAMHNQVTYSMWTGILRLPAYREKEHEMDRRAHKLLKIFDLDGEAGLRASQLPYGKQRKLEIARALATNPKLLLLDEPAAGMNPNETAELMNTVRSVRDQFGIAILLIEHDMNFVMGICEEITVLDYGRVIARGDGKAMRRQSALGLRLSFVVGLPCSIGMSLLSSQILSLIYHFDTPEALRVTAELLSLSSLTIVLFTVVQSTSGILQGLRKQRIPMYTLIAGVAVKVLLNYTLIGMPGINIYGAPIASLACYTISMLPNLWYVRKYTGMKLDLKGILLKPALATALMGAVLAPAIRLLPSGRLWTLALVALGVCTYAAFALLTGALTRDDLAPLLRRFGRGRAPKKED